MKIIVFADSHTDVSTMLAVVELEQPNVILHLGDHIADGIELQKNTDIRVHLVKGNTDLGSCGSVEESVTFGNTRVYMTHGHVYKVKNGLAELCEAGARNNAHIVLFGHTHRPFLSHIDGMWVMNPGRIGRRFTESIPATYGAIVLSGSRIECGISEVKL